MRCVLIISIGPAVFGIDDYLILRQNFCCRDVPNVFRDVLPPLVLSKPVWLDTSALWARQLSQLSHFAPETVKNG